jgi:acylphosphatase
MICKRCLVSGRVQGVWFRDSTRRKAEQLGLSGSATNLGDGSVEVIACGDPRAVDELCTWLWEGSPMSRVNAVRCEDAEPFATDGFAIA